MPLRRSVGQEHRFRRQFVCLLVQELGLVASVDTKEIVSGFEEGVDMSKIIAAQMLTIQRDVSEGISSSAMKSDGRLMMLNG